MWKGRTWPRLSVAFKLKELLGALLVRSAPGVPAMLLELVERETQSWVSEFQTNLAELYRATGRISAAEELEKRAAHIRAIKR